MGWAVCLKKGDIMYSAVLDIETTDLGAVGAGIITCVCVRPMQTKRTRTFHLGMYEFEPDPMAGFLEREETALLEAVRDELRKYHILIGHNLERFDIPYIRSRAFIRGVTWDVYPVIYDTLKAFRRTRFLTRPNGFGGNSGGLAHVADFAGAVQDKTAIYPRAWWEQIWGNKKKRLDALNEVAEHCAHDVRMNAAIFDFLWAADMKPILRRAI